MLSDGFGKSSVLRQQQEGHRARKSSGGRATPTILRIPLNDRHNPIRKIIGATLFHRHPQSNHKFRLSPAPRITIMNPLPMTGRACPRA